MKKQGSNSIMVSIICNTYNHEKYIAQTIEGFLMQKTKFRFEVLIHDDASTDKTAEIIRKYEKQYPDIIKPIYQTDNQYSMKVYVSVKYQYPRAEGKYIAYCEGDDFWTDCNKLQKQVDFLNNHPEYVACVHKYIVVDKTGKENNIRTFGYYESGGEYTLKDYETGELPSQLATVVVRNIFTDNASDFYRIFKNIRLQGDIKLFLYFLGHGKIYRMDDTMSAYRFVIEDGGGSWSSRTKGAIRNVSDWCETNKLEKAFKDRFGKSIYLKYRRIQYSVGAWYDFKRKKNLKNFINIFKMIILQKGTLGEYLKRFMRKCKNADK